MYDCIYRGDPGQGGVGGDHFVKTPYLLASAFSLHRLGSFGVGEQIFYLYMAYELSKMPSETDISPWDGLY